MSTIDTSQINNYQNYLINNTQSTAAQSTVAQYLAQAVLAVIALVHSIVF